MAENEEKPIRVVDRRMFTAEGELRPDFEPEEPAAEPKPPEASPARAASPARPAGPEPSRPPDAPPSKEGEPRPAGEEGTEEEAADPHSEFTAIVRSLATTAYAALGLLPDPAGARRREPAVARQMIDWLSVLEAKTRNNLSFEESDFLSRVLYELRLAFVEVTRGPAR